MDHFKLIPEDHEFTKQPATIPRILHLIWVGDSPQPDYVDEYVAKWRNLMPEWQVRLWTNADITADEFPAQILPKINACEKGAQKADIMRFFIVYKYGGVYVDTDISPARSLQPIVDLGAPVVLCHDMAVTWQYIASAFFAAVPNNPLFARACALCCEAAINTAPISHHTGPRLLGRAMYDVKPDEPYAMLHRFYFYRNRVGDIIADYTYRDDEFLQRFGSHLYAKGW